MPVAAREGAKGSGSSADLVPKICCSPRPAQPHCCVGAESLRVLAVAVADERISERDSDIEIFLSLMDYWAPRGETPPVDGASVPARRVAEPVLPSSLSAQPGGSGF